MKQLPPLLVVAAFLFSCSSLTPDLRADSQARRVKSGHTAPPAGLIYEGERNLLLSWGSDGTIRIWDPGNGDPRGFVRIGYRPIQKVALHPSEPQVAVLEGGEAGSSATLSVWDYQNGRMLFSLPLQEQVLCLDYSAQGSYLIYSRADYDSLVMIDARSGRKINYLNKGFGIVSFFVTSRNENNLMTYQPSGVIGYWDIRTGKSLRKLATSADLSGMHISPNLRFMAACGTDTLEIVDLLTGTVLTRESLPGVRELAFSPLGNELVVRRASGSASLLERFYFNGENLFKLGTAGAPAGGGLCCLAYGDGGIYLADQDSALYLMGLDGSMELLVRNRLLALNDFAVSPDCLAAVSAAEVMVFTSDFFSSGTGSGTTFEQRVFPNPFSGPAGLLFLGEDELLVWRRGGDAALPQRLAVLNRYSGRILRTSEASDFGTALVQVEKCEYGLIVVEKSGRCRIIDPDTFATLFEYTSPGMNRLIAAGGEELIGAKSSLSDLDRSPLLQINRRTGETVSIADSSIFLYDLLFDEGTGNLFSLGVDRMSGKLSTLLRYHFGQEFEKERILFTFTGEDLSADLTIDGSGRLYTSLGWHSVRIWEKGRLRELEPSGGIPRRLESSGNLVYALNSDSTFTVWDLNSRRNLYTFYLFQETEPDGGHAWAALTPAGAALATPRARAYLSADD